MVTRVTSSAQANPNGGETRILKTAVLFDLGQTLVAYYERSEFPGILDEAIRAVEEFLRGKHILNASPEEIRRGVEAENHEASDYRVRPLEERLIRIFHLQASDLPDFLTSGMCRRFMNPIFRRARYYDDVLPTLRSLKTHGVKTAIVSNSPWGSPAYLWREEINRLGLGEHVDATVFCGDVGWRKPASQIFQCTVEKLSVHPSECIFVGDDPRWDVVGPRTFGMEAILIDRKGALPARTEKPIRSLHELLPRLCG